MLRYSTLPTERFTTLKHHIQWKLFITNSIFGSKHWEGNTLYDYFYSIQMSNFTGPTGTHFTRNCELTIPWAANFLKWAVVKMTTLQWRHDERDGVSNHRCLDCLLNRLFRCRSKKTSKLCVPGLCGRNSPVTNGFPSQRVSNAENISIWWRN